jgi:hypothetical protein
MSEYNVLQLGKLYKLNSSTTNHYLLVVSDEKVVDTICYGDTFIPLELLSVTEFGMGLFKLLTKNGKVGVVGIWEHEVILIEK